MELVRAIVPFKPMVVRFCTSCHTCQLLSNGMLLKLSKIVNSFGSALIKLPSKPDSVAASVAAASVPAACAAAVVLVVSPLFPEQPAVMDAVIAANSMSAITFLESFFIFNFLLFLSLYTAHGKAGLKVLLNKREHNQHWNDRNDDHSINNRSR